MTSVNAATEVRDSTVELVAQCRVGNRDAQYRLYEMLHERIYGLMVRMVGRQDAADLTQEAFLRVFQAIGQFSGKSQLATWAYRVAANEALQYLRRSKRTNDVPLDRDPVDASPDENVENRDLLEQALTRLEPDLRSIFALKEIDQLPYREIAEALEISEGTVGSRLNRARRQLRQHLVQLGWERT